jgi:hypothetical protein
MQAILPKQNTAINLLSNVSNVKQGLTLLYLSPYHNISVPVPFPVHVPENSCF